jgi:NADH-quinone oxidoreductase subunit L
MAMMTEPAARNNRALKKGGLRKYMPITWITMLIGSLALIGTPGFAGFYSKDSIIEAVAASHLAGSGLAYAAVLGGVFITALYSFRMYFLVFHGKERMDEHTREHLHETPWVVTGPLILLAIPSIVIGYLMVDSVVFGDFFKGAITVLPEHDVLGHLKQEYHGPAAMILHAFTQWPIWLAAAGVLVAWFLYLKRPDLPDRIRQKTAMVYKILIHKYGFDEFYQTVFAGGGRALGRLFWNIGDIKLIDGVLVNGTAHMVGATATVIRHLQTGYLYHYAFAMIIGLLFLLGWYVL